MAIRLPNVALSTPGTLIFEDLVREHQNMVFSIAFHFLGDRAAAEESAQDVFVQLHRRLSQMQSSEHVVFWLRRVAVNRCISEARKRSRRQEVPLDEVPEPEAPELAGDPIADSHVRKLVASLPEKARAVVVLRYQEDLDPDDIARVLGTSVNTVKSQLQRALIMLRRKAEQMQGTTK